MNPARALLAIFAALALGGCALLGGKSPPVSTYAITLERPTLVAGADAAPVSWQLLIETPTAPTQLATTRIAVRAEDGSYGVLQGARWSEAAPELVASLLLQGYEHSGRILGVGRSGDALQADYLLLVELRLFEADYREAGASAALAVNVRLVRNASRQVLATRVFEVREPAPGQGAAAVSQAFDRAASRLVPEVVNWTLTAGEADWRAKR